MFYVCLQLSSTAQYLERSLLLSRRSQEQERLSASMLAVWLSGNTLASINVVALRQTRLVLGWVTVCGRVNHLGM